MTRARILADYVSSGDELAAVATTANGALQRSGGVMTGAITTNSTFDGVDIATAVAANTAKVTNSTSAADLTSGTLPIARIADDAITGGKFANDIAISTSGATALTGTLTVGVDGTGQDVKFFADDAGSFMNWDESENTLEIRGGGEAFGIAEGKLLLSTAEATIVDGNKLGQIDFQAPVEGDGTDSRLVSASIWAEADETFSSSVNETSLVFATGASETATEKMRVAYNGNVTVNTGNLVIPTADKGIYFSGGTDPDTSGTATGNILDDFEEGTWTPMDTDSGGSEQYGMYTKIGNLVTISFWVRTGGISGSDTFYLKGFPFTCGSTDAFRGAVSIAYTNASYFVHQGYVNNNNTTAYMMQGSGSIATDDHIGGSKVLAGSAVYRVA